MKPFSRTFKTHSSKLIYSNSQIRPKLSLCDSRMLPIDTYGAQWLKRLRVVSQILSCRKSRDVWLSSAVQSLLVRLRGQHSKRRGMPLPSTLITSIIRFLKDSRCTWLHIIEDCYCYLPSGIPGRLLEMDVVSEDQCCGIFQRRFPFFIYHINDCDIICAAISSKWALGMSESSGTHQYQYRSLWLWLWATCSN